MPSLFDFERDEVEESRSSQSVVAEDGFGGSPSTSQVREA